MARISRRKLEELKAEMAAVNKRQVAERVAQAILEGTQRAFMAKSGGGSDEFGNTWQPLEPSTKDKKAATARFNQVRTRVQQLARLLMNQGMSKSNAIARAVDIAQSGLGVPINVDTMRLLESIDPERAGNPDQVREFDGETLRLGTKVPYAKYVQAQRPFWPKPEEARKWVRETAVELRDEMVVKFQVAR